MEGGLRLRIAVLGSLTVNGHPGALLPAQSQLLVALALRGRAGTANSALCRMLGPDGEHPRHSDSLRQLIVRTRRQIGLAPDGAEWIEYLGRGRYALHRDAWLDLAEFDRLTARSSCDRESERLTSALSMVRGAPFADCCYWWIDEALIEWARTRIIVAARRLARICLADGQPSAAARAARAGLTADASAECLWRALMRSEHAAGSLAGVHEAWIRCRDVSAEIAADGRPERETAELYEQLLMRH